MKLTIDLPRLVALLKARRAQAAHPGQLTLFGGGLVPKRVEVAAHTRQDGTHVPTHTTTVYVRPDEPVAHHEAPVERVEATQEHVSPLAHGDSVHRVIATVSDAASVSSGALTAGRTHPGPPYRYMTINRPFTRASGLATPSFVERNNKPRTAAGTYGRVSYNDIVSFDARPPDDVAYRAGLMPSAADGGPLFGSMGEWADAMKETAVSDGKRWSIAGERVIMTNPGTEQERPVVVVKDGAGNAQAFYRSTGFNGGAHEGEWVPFYGMAERQGLGVPWLVKHGDYEKRLPPDSPWADVPDWLAKQDINKLDREDVHISGHRGDEPSTRALWGGALKVNDHLRQHGAPLRDDHERPSDPRWKVVSPDVIDRRIDDMRFLGMLKAEQLSLFGAGHLVPKKVSVPAHTRSDGTHVAQHTTTVYVRQDEPVAHDEAPVRAEDTAPRVTAREAFSMTRPQIVAAMQQHAGHPPTVYALQAELDRREAKRDARAGAGLEQDGAHGQGAARVGMTGATW